MNVKKINHEINAAVESSTKRNTEEMIEDGFLVFSKEKTIVYGDEHACRLFGVDQNEIIGRNLFDEFPEKIEPELEIALQKTLEDNKTVSTEVFFTYFNSWFGINIYPSGGTLSVYFRDISGKKQTEQALRESEEHFRTALKNSYMIVFRLNKDFEYTWIYMPVSKLGFKDVIGKKDEDLFSPDAAADLLSLKTGAVKNKTCVKGEIKIKQAGQTLFYQVIYEPVYNDEGEISGLTGASLDITERKKAEERIKESEERYRSIFEASSVPILIVDPKGLKIININKAAVDYYGIGRDEFVGKNINYISESQVSRLTKNADDILKSGANYFTGRHRLSNGEIREVEGYFSPIKYSGKDMIMCVLTDISERRKAEKELSDYKDHLEQLVARRTEKIINANKRFKKENKKLQKADEEIKNQLSFLRLLLDTIPIPVFIRDNNNVYRDCNTSFEKFHSIKREYLIGKNIHDFLPNEIVQKNERMDRKLMKDGKIQSYESFFIDKEGNKKDVIVYKAKYGKADGGEGGIIGTVIDISSRKKLEENIRTALKQEKELNDLKTRFISITSHEFRTPITTIRSSAELIGVLNSAKDSLKREEHLNRIKETVDNMTELLDDILTINRAETGTAEFNPGTLNIKKLLDALVAKLSYLSNAGHTIKCDIRTGNTRAALDKRLMELILTNLFSNAVKYSPPGEEIQFNAYKAGTNLVMEISDRGIGIPEEEIPHIFDAFHRGANVSGIKGTGLGLSIVQKAAELHGGSIEVQSEINRGAKFTLKIPLKEEVNN